MMRGVAGGLDARGSRRSALRGPVPGAGSRVVPVASEPPVVRKGIGIYGTATLIRVKPTVLDLFSVK